jgi:hypothetical protein
MELEELFGNLDLSRNVICIKIPQKFVSNSMRFRGYPCIRSNYNEQKKYWDDGEKNNTEVGDVFIFWDDLFIFHMVECVHEPTPRKKEWTDSVGNNKRNVLELSQPKFTLSYEDMMNYGAKPRIKYPKSGFHKGSELMRMIEREF